MDKWTEGELQVTPKTKVSAENKDVLDNVDSFVRKLIQGNMGLPMTYWVYGVLASFVWGFSFVSLGIFFEFNATSEAAKFLYFLMVVYFAIVYIGIWNSAGKYKGSKVWQIMARFVVVITAIPIVLGTLKVLTI